MKKLVVTRCAYAYVWILFALEAVLLVLSAFLHLSVLIGAREPFIRFGAASFRGTIVVGIPVAAFIKDGSRWTDQLKACPRWMWKTALTLAVYAIFTLGLQAIFPEGNSFAEESLAVSGFPLGFDAIALCIIYSVLRSSYLTESDVAHGAGKSLLMVCLGVVAFLAYRAGYLRHPKN